MRDAFSRLYSEMEGCGDEYRKLRRSGVAPLRSVCSQERLCGGDRKPDQRACGIRMNR